MADSSSEANQPRKSCTITTKMHIVCARNFAEIERALELAANTFRSNKYIDLAVGIKI